jgi:hypothetical protein
MTRKFKNNNAEESSSRQNRIVLPSPGSPNPFKCPDGYFDGLTAQVLNRIESDQEEKEKKHILLFHLNRKYATAAVLVVAVVVAAVFLLDKPSVRSTDESVASSSIIELLDEDPDFVNIFDEELLVDYCAAAGIPWEEETGVSIVDELTRPDTAVGSDEIINYLMDENNIDNYILNEL